MGSRLQRDTGECLNGRDLPAEESGAVGVRHREFGAEAEQFGAHGVVGVSFQILGIRKMRSSDPTANYRSVSLCKVLDLAKG